MAQRFISILGIVSPLQGEEEIGGRDPGVARETRLPPATVYNRYAVEEKQEHPTFAYRRLTTGH